MDKNPDSSGNISSWIRIGIQSRIDFFYSVSGFSSLLDLETFTGSELSINTRSLNLAELGSLLRTILADISPQLNTI